jgi:hypothetical protein
MALWFEENLPALLVGFALGAFLIELFSSADYVGLLGGLAGVGVALPIWQADKDKWLRRK